MSGTTLQTCVDLLWRREASWRPDKLHIAAPPDLGLFCQLFSLKTLSKYHVCIQNLTRTLSNKQQRNNIRPIFASLLF